MQRDHATPIFGLIEWMRRLMRVSIGARHPEDQT